MSPTNYLPEVLKQYEDYPYPERNPNDERRRLYPPMLDCLDRVNYYCFQGKKCFDGNFRALVAGGGTGDTAIFLAEQLRHCGAEVVYLDLSSASMEVARQRAAIRGLDNITWVKGSLLDVPEMGLGYFDYINSCGVLHHLESPNQGLSALNSVLKDDGAMGIMVYAKYGRTAIYLIQDLMRRINHRETNMQTKVDNCKKVLDSLPETHWFTHEKRLVSNWGYKRPIELYDLFLHSQDRAYSVPELYEFVEDSDLQILHMCMYGSDERGNRVYDPCDYIDDRGIIEDIRVLPKMKQQAIAELLHGKISTHSFYVARNTRPVPTPEDLSNIPYLDILTGREEYSALYSLVRNSPDTIELRRGDPEYSVSLSKRPTYEGIFKYLDGRRNLKTIFRKIMASQKYKKARPTIPKLQKEFKEIISAFGTYEWMFLRHDSVEYPATIQEMESRMER